MALELNGTTGVSLVQDGVVTAADLASTLDLTGKTVTLPSGTGGKVLQVVSTTSGLQFAVTSTSWVGLNFSVNITPSSASSKILIMLLSGMADIEPSRQSQFTFFRNDTTNLGESTRGLSQLYSASGRQQSPISFGKIDEPSTTSSTEYQIYMRANTTETVYLNTDGCVMTLMAMEIAA